MTCALVFLLFSALPQLDLRASAAFFDPATRRFVLDGWPPAEALRNAVWNLSIVVALAALALSLVAALRRSRRVLGVPFRAWAYVVAVYALAVGVLVENLLKRGWGRARPPQITEFGGEAAFTPVNVLSGACVRNCSFVSGEVAGAVALSLGLAVLLAWAGPRLPGALRAPLWALTLAAPVFVMAQRFLSGRHFLSDVLLAALFTGLVAAVLALVFRPFPGGVDNPGDSP
ncbi:phosphatase PAP2 family protein [Rhodobacter sp. Har01]|uniref:phosphatase PAP2 family protein n=1 Tax=Rhodobacter sp. Har01 TaxID=2883999 RepID=UPI001D0655BE|nr:phosphatase PAP2 family protein [Rhodobacter sp. Har01]MCB6180049.1 phosphatase PAP2 family protein [Rhodobacter sp. Har01]